MGIDDSTKIVLGSKRFQNAVDVDSSEKLPLYQTTKEVVEYERTIDVNLFQVFDDERQASNIFRPVSKYVFLFKNSFPGVTQYQPYIDYLYYLNLDQAVEQIACGATSSVSWSGFPQYTEFDFIRNDNDKNGYTTGSPNHQQFVNKSATTYNWKHYVSYPFENDPNKNMFAEDDKTFASWNWIAQDGIPFVITSNSNSIIEFRCPMPHGLNNGEYVQLSLTYNGENIFAINSLGNGTAGSEGNYFNVYNVGYLGTTFNVGNIGYLKRVLNPDSSGETTSKYYVRRNKIITNPEDAVLVKTAFENNVFNLKTQYEKPIYYGNPPTLATPTSLPRTSILEGSQTYTLSFNVDIDTTNLIDNQKRPITELFFTSIWKGYWGWTNKLKQGYYFNTKQIFGLPSVWWDLSNTFSDTNIPTQQYNSNIGIGPFTYISDLTSGDTIDGDFCEWNDYEQTERVISKQVHKITFNQTYFTQNLDTSPTNTFGYYYYPHNSITIKTFSPYVEEGPADVNIVGIPNYAFFSNASNSFRWRDIYPFGYIDNENVGVDYPFTNGKHYPYDNIIFRLFPDNYQGIGQNLGDLIVDPTTDECE